MDARCQRRVPRDSKISRDCSVRTIAAKITIVAKTTDRGAKAKEPRGDKSGIVEVHVVVGGDIVNQQWSRGCVRTWYNSFTKKYGLGTRPLHDTASSTCSKVRKGWVRYNTFYSHLENHCWSKSSHQPAVLSSLYSDDHHQHHHQHCHQHYHHRHCHHGYQNRKALKSASGGLSIAEAGQGENAGHGPGEVW